MHHSKFRWLMSALGQKQTSRPVCAMSALPPKADIAECDGDVRFVPKADVTHATDERSNNESEHRKQNLHHVDLLLGLASPRIIVSHRGQGLFESLFIKDELLVGKYEIPFGD